MIRPKGQAATEHHPLVPMITLPTAQGISTEQSWEASEQDSAFMGQTVAPNPALRAKSTLEQTSRVGLM